MTEDPSEEWTKITPVGIARPRGRARFFSMLGLIALHEFRARYRSQALGMVWTILQPIVTMGIVAAILPRVFGTERAHLRVFLLIGLVFWSFVSHATNAAVSALVWRAQLVRNTLLPRSVLPLGVMLSYLPNVAIESVALLAFAALTPDSFRLSPALFVAPAVFVLLVFFLGGVVLVASALDVFYRDVGYIASTALSLGFWVTPIVYPLDAVPPPYRAVVAANPLTVMLGALRDALMTGAYPDARAWAVMIGTAAVSFVVGFAAFRRLEGAVLDGI